jgi:methionyl-tRNA formyltransferase
VRIVFFGTPEFAVPSFHALLGEGFDVLAAVTQPDRPRGRSRSALEPSPIKIAAEAEGVPVLQPERPASPEFVERIRALAPDAGVVVAYGHILRPELLAVPRHGMINVHPSLLPELRGAAPVEWAILKGYAETGVSIMQMDEGLDSGPVIHRIPHRIDAGVTGGELTEHLAEMGAQALVEALAMLEQDGLRPVPQDHSKATFAPKLTRAVARIDWTRPADVVARWTRGLDPRPGAWTELDGAPNTKHGAQSTEHGAVEVKLFGGFPVDGQGEPGEVVRADERLAIACGMGAVEVEEVQPAGKARMPAGDWVRGRGVAAGQRFA